MGTLIQLILRLLGRPTHARQHGTWASISTDLLPSPKWLRPWWAALIHALPILAVFCWIFIRRADDVSASAGEIVAVAVTSSWCVIGPALIWTYERRTLPRLARSTRIYLRGAPASAQLRKTILAGALWDKTSRVILVLWLLTVITGLISSYEYFFKFGLYGYVDPLYWIVIGGVLYVALYTHIGISFLVRSISLIRQVTQAAVVPNVYAADATLGLSFLGRFALSTNLMYLSGWLFMPALFVSAKHGSGAPVWATHTVLALGYASFCLVGFLSSLTIVHRRLVEIKCRLAEEHGTTASKLGASLSSAGSGVAAHKFLATRAIYRDVIAISEWPLSVDALVKFVGTVVIFPLVVNVVAIWWVT